MKQQHFFSARDRLITFIDILPTILNRWTENHFAPELKDKSMRTNFTQKCTECIKKPVVSELNTKTTRILLSVGVRPQGSVWAVKQKLFFSFLICQCNIDSQQVLIKKSVQFETWSGHQDQSGVLQTQVNSWGLTNVKKRDEEENATVCFTGVLECSLYFSALRCHRGPELRPINSPWLSRCKSKGIPLRPWESPNSDLRLSLAPPGSHTPCFCVA